MSEPEPPTGGPPEADTPPSSPPSTRRDSMARGLGVGALVLAVNELLFFIPGLGLAALFPGVTQWVAVIPLAVTFWQQGRRASCRGLLLAAALVALLNATCCGLVLYQM